LIGNVADIKVDQKEHFFYVLYLFDSKKQYSCIY